MSEPIVLADIRERLERFIRDCLVEYQQAERDENRDFPARPRALSERVPESEEPA